MADIRIKDLAVTASSSASDDYLAVDGSTNGTRKLSAYSPTFGGNLTVSGTGNNVFRGPIRWGNTNFPGNNGYISEASTNSGLFPAIARNLIGSTGSNYTIADGAYGYYSGFEFSSDIRWFADTGTFTTGQSLVPTERMRLTYQGNLLIGTTTDLGQKLQVNGTAYVSGDATFAGTVTAVGISTFKRSDNTGSIRVVPTSGVSAGSDLESFNLSTLAYGRLNARGTHLQVYTGTNATTLALTVDDSQRTILSGALRLNNAYTAGAPAATGYVTIQDSAGNTYKVLVGT